jgi:hypothetical protein
MRTILFSLTTLFAISITGCLDDAQQPESNQRSLAVEQHPEAMQEAAAEPALRDDLPDQPIATQDELDGSGAADSAPTDESDPLFCNTVADCEPGYWCRIDTNRCIAAKH